MLFGVCIILGLASSAFADPFCLSSGKFTAKVKQTTVTVSSGATAPEVYDTFSIMDFDYDLMMTAQMSTRFDAMTGMLTNYTLVEDYKNNKMYVKAPGYCKEQPFDAPAIFRCVPDNMTHVGSYTAPGGQTMVNWFAGDRNGQMSYIHVTSNGEPFAFSSYGQNAEGLYVSTSMTYGDVMMGVLSDPDVFKNVECQGPNVPIGK